MTNKIIDNHNNEKQYIDKLIARIESSKHKLPEYILTLLPKNITKSYNNSNEIFNKLIHYLNRLKNDPSRDQSMIYASHINSSYMTMSFKFNDFIEYMTKFKYEFILGKDIKSLIELIQESHKNDNMFLGKLISEIETSKHHFGFNLKQIASDFLKSHFRTIIGLRELIKQLNIKINEVLAIKSDLTDIENIKTGVKNIRDIASGLNDDHIIISNNVKKLCEEIIRNKDYVADELKVIIEKLIVSKTNTILCLNDFNDELVIEKRNFSEKITLLINEIKEKHGLNLLNITKLMDNVKKSKTTNSNLINGVNNINNNHIKTNEKINYLSNLIKILKDKEIKIYQTQSERDNLEKNTLTKYMLKEIKTTLVKTNDKNKINMINFINNIKDILLKNQTKK